MGLPLTVGFSSPPTEQPPGLPLRPLCGAALGLGLHLPPAHQQEEVPWARGVFLGVFGQKLWSSEAKTITWCGVYLSYDLFGGWLVEPQSKRPARGATPIWSSPHGLTNDPMGIMSLSMLLSVTHPKPGTGCDPVSSEALPRPSFRYCAHPCPL